MHTLWAEATDLAGNVGNSDLVTITVLAPAEPDTTAPIVQITQPADSAQLVEDITICVEATDDRDIACVIFMVDGEFLAADSLAPYEELWILPPPISGDIHILQASATDRAGNVGHAEDIMVTVLWSGDVPLGDVLAAAGPGDHNGFHFTRYIELNPAYTYRVDEQIPIEIDTCIRGNGAVIDLANAGSLVVTRSGGGTTVRCDIDHCLIINGYIPASAAPFGGALEYARNTQGWVVNNTFYNNDPAALYIHESPPDPDMRVVNNIFYWNLQGLLRHYNQVSLDIKYNDSVGNNINFGDHCGCPETPLADEIELDGISIHGSNFSEDPHFVQTPNPPKHIEGDFHLRADSPCRGTGENGTDIGAFPYMP